jgi:hypothetical protein
MRAKLASLTATVLIAAACGAPAAPSPSTASPSEFPTGVFTPPPSQTPPASPTPGASPTPASAGNWESAGSMSIGRLAPHAVPLGNGLVLVVGNDTGLCIRDNSVRTEFWYRSVGDEEEGPSSGSWDSYTALDKPRADFVAVPLADGRVLLTGGVGPGTDGEYGHKSYSSTFIYTASTTYTPTDEDDEWNSPVWSPGASLGTARTSPSAAKLADGRVLVLGGYSLTGAERPNSWASTVVLAAWRPGPILANSGPPPTLVPALATAEVYDPAADSWSATGPMHYARVGAQAITLADGRVLVVGSSMDVAGGWNYTQIRLAGRAYSSAEIYDPRTGRFTLTGELPPSDWSPFANLGLGGFSVDSSDLISSGTLVALRDGGALLVGRTEQWYASGAAASAEGYDVRALRFDPLTGQWTEIDRSVEVYSSDALQAGTIVQGHVPYHASAASLADGRVIVAGGERRSGSDAFVALDTAALYDPGSDTWTALPPMPEHRAGGTAVALPDGSALLVGGNYETSLPWGCADSATGLASTVRFVPGP